MTLRNQGTRILCLIVGVLTATAASAVDVWITSGDQSRLLSQQPDVVIDDGLGASGVAIIIDPSQRFQTMRGYGASMTNSSASVFRNGMTADTRADVMDDLFSSADGIGLNYLRVVMGASDFTADGFYTYNDLPAGQTDPTQSQFSIDADRPTILPSLDEARALNPDLRLMATPWSAPGWMKTSGSVIGGELDPQWHASYATYLQKFVEAYEAEGHPIDTLSLANEPLFTPTSYPGMGMSATQQIDLIKNHVGPGFAGAGLSTELLAYDHNWDNTAYPIQVLNDPDARQYVAGTAFHGYAGDVSAQTVVRNAHPDKEIYFTEISGGDFAPNFEDNLVWYARNLLIGGARNWGATVIMWNLALDENGDPHLGGCPNCRGVVTVDSQSGAVTHNEEFYALGQASQFVQPGAVRIGSTSINNFMETVAFENPDGSRVLLALNPTGSDQPMRGIIEGEHFAYTVPARSVGTFFWEGAGGATFDNGGFESGGYHTTGGSLDGWLDWGNTAGNVSVTDTRSLDGENTLELTGAGGGASFSGVSQGISIDGGDRIRVDASVLLPTAGSIAGTDNVVLMKVEYYDSYGAEFQGAGFLGQTQIEIADGLTPTDQWIAHSIDEVAPAGAEEARLVFVFAKAAGANGSVLVDGVSFGVVQPVAGDFNGDGFVDVTDYTEWQNTFGQTVSPGSGADGNGDGVVNAADYTVWRDNLPNPPAALPEPTSAVLVSVAALALCRASSR